MTAARRNLLTTSALVIALGACSPAPAPSPLSSPLSGAIARVGAVAISPSLVADVAQAKGISAHDALGGLVEDVLAAQAAEARGLDRDPSVSWSRAAALAVQVPAHLTDEAMALGPPTEDELALVSVVHAVVLRSPNLREDDALAIAAAIRRAVAGGRSADDFEARANAVSHPHAEVRVERIGPFGADGRAPDGTGFDATFVAAAFSLRAPFETSAIVATPFGWHVLQLVERTPAGGSVESRRVDLAGAVFQLRTRIRLEALVQARRQSVPVTISVAADDLMSAAFARP
jgi:hypothetical protein